MRMSFARSRSLTAMTAKKLKNRLPSRASGASSAVSIEARFMHSDGSTESRASSSRQPIRNSGWFSTVHAPALSGHALREERHGEGDNAQNTKNGLRQLRLHIEHAPQTVAGPVFVLEDLGEIVVRFGIVQPGEVHVQQLVGVDLLVDKVAVVV